MEPLNWLILEYLQRMKPVLFKAHRIGVNLNLKVAPEVIEMTGISSSSDIWSLGCTAIELYTGKPPLYDLEPVSALFRIVTDERVQYPQNISSVSNTLDRISAIFWIIAFSAIEIFELLHID
jgi:serine/threonine protein kinase